VVRANGSVFGEVYLKALITDQIWHHLAMVRKPDGHVVVFLDGKQVDQGNGGNTAGSITTDLRAIGGDLRPGFAPPRYEGAVDELCIFGRDLSADEIAALAGKVELKAK